MVHSWAPTSSALWKVRSRRYASNSAPLGPRLTSSLPLLPRFSGLFVTLRYLYAVVAAVSSVLPVSHDSQMRLLSLPPLTCVSGPARAAQAGLPSACDDVAGRTA